MSDTGSCRFGITYPGGTTWRKCHGISGHDGPHWVADRTETGTHFEITWGADTLRPTWPGKMPYRP